MALALFAWLALQSPFCATSHRHGASLNSSEAQKPRRIIEHCVFCQAYSSNREAFDIVWEVRRRHLALDQLDVQTPSGRMQTFWLSVTVNPRAFIISS